MTRAVVGAREDVVVVVGAEAAGEAVGVGDGEEAGVVDAGEGVARVGEGVEGRRTRFSFETARLIHVDVTANVVAM